MRDGLVTALAANIRPVGKRGKTMTSIIRVRMNDGRELTTRAAFAKGSPANPMSEGELLQPRVRAIAGLLSAHRDGRSPGARL